MKLKIVGVILAIVLLSIPTYTTAAPVLDETVGVLGSSWEIYSFVADQTPLIYQVTLIDHLYPAAFDFLGVAITASTDSVVKLNLCCQCLGYHCRYLRCRFIRH